MGNWIDKNWPTGNWISKDLRYMGDQTLILRKEQETSREHRAQSTIYFMYVGFDTGAR